MARPTRYLTRMVLFLVIVCAAVTLLFPALRHAFTANAVLNGVILGALYMLRFAQSFLFGVVKAPHLPLTDLDLREKLILAAIVAAVFALGLFPDEPMRKTEIAAKQYQQLVRTARLPGSP